MDKRFAIFDMDGTLVDSMIYWKHLATEFLESKGVQIIAPDILEQIKPMTMELLKEIVSSVSIPVVAIGGISADNILQLSGSRVDGVAVVSAIFAADDPGKATADLLKLAKEMVASHG